MLIFGIISAAGIGGFGNYIDVPSAIITFGGAIAAVMCSYSMSDFVTGLKSFTLIFKAPSLNTADMIKKIIDLSNVARKEGLLSLEEAASDMDEPFLKKGILLVVDGTDPDLVRGILETEMANIESRHKNFAGFWETLGSMGPAWGMIGTLIGLINMLKNLSDPSSLGPAMAVALVTTFYGSLIANWICAPVANKLKMKNASEMSVKGIMVEGLLSIQAGENPRVIEEKLKSFISPTERKAMAGDAGAAAAGGEG
jgi:chemotaxis protein MotA